MLLTANDMRFFVSLMEDLFLLFLKKLKLMLEAKKMSSFKSLAWLKTFLRFRLGSGLAGREVQPGSGSAQSKKYMLGIACLLTS